MDVITPPLDGTILPGITRASCLELAAAHPKDNPLPGLPVSLRLHSQEREITMTNIAEWSTQGKLLEAFGTGTAHMVDPVGRIGYGGADIVLPTYEGAFGPVAKALKKRIFDIQQGKVEWCGWSVVCE